MDAPTPTVPPAPTTEPAEPSTLLDRLTNVIAAPADAFGDIKNRPVGNLNWCVPLLLCCLGGIFYCIMAFSQPAVVQSLQDQREKAIQKQVVAGKMTQAQADQALPMIEKMMSSMIMMILGSGGAIIFSSFGLFSMALAIWLSLKMFSEAKLAYMKVVEICGLTLVIDIPQKIVRTWLVTWKENMIVTLSPTLFVAHPDMQNRTHVLLTMFDPIDVWWLAVLSFGVSKVSGIRYGKAACITFGIWIVFFGLRVLMTQPQ